MRLFKTIGATSFLLVALFYFTSSLLVSKETSVASEVKGIVITPEIAEKYPLKHMHAKLSLDCVFCHVDQGTDPEKFTIPDEKTSCLSCHKSKEYLAQRLEFMDTLKTNPHNSIHDGPTLYCDECHRMHEPSVNMCSECHLKEIDENVWMRATP